MNPARLKDIKINIQKSTVFLDTKSNQPKNEIKKITPFIIASKRKNILKDKLNKTRKTHTPKTTKHC